MFDGGLRRSVPEQLRVEVGMGINKARGNHLALGVDGLDRLFGNGANLNDDAIFNAHIGVKGGQPATVYYLAISDYQVEHVSSQFLIVFNAGP
jgi:hypothetical protein